MRVDNHLYTYTRMQVFFHKQAIQKIGGHVLTLTFGTGKFEHEDINISLNRMDDGIKIQK
jgi:hypothetical protein